MDDLVERLWGDDTHSRDYYATNDPIRLEAAAEITRLRAALETARRDALEEAWKVADAAADTALKQSGQGHAHGWCAYRMAQAQEIASAIRAMIQANTSPS